LFYLALLLLNEITGASIALFGGFGNYASALYLAVVKVNALEKVESELLDPVEASKKSPTFAQFAKDLSVPGETRVKALRGISAEAEFSDLTKNFLGTKSWTLWLNSRLY
jgi:F-type H+-transporting ATPase subunit O